MDSSDIVKKVLAKYKKEKGIADETTSKSVPKYLFHGTDAKIVKLSTQERMAFLNSCRDFIDFAVPFFSVLPEECPNGLNPNVFRSIPCAIQDARERHNGNMQYQYGDIYLTRYASDAFGYAMRAWAGGELARDAYSLAKGADYLRLEGWSPDGRMKNIMERIISFAEIPANPVAFYIPTEHLDLEKLKEFRGGPVDWDVAALFRYLGEMPQLDLSKAAFLPKDCHFMDIDAGVIFANVEPAF